ncbi:MAG: hypothetical protein MI802_09115 [Desulfobacterales bacterium]|nr:hypothetical protein [Desulfobacterales bacterium]
MTAGCVSSDFEVETLAKSDINQVSDIHIDQSLILLKDLTRKLYKMNSEELARSPGSTIDTQITKIFQCPPLEPLPVMNGKRSTDAILLSFDKAYEGDRVYALMYGLFTMLHAAYNQKCDLFMLDFLDAQNLYNSARNIEILVWRMKTRYKPDGTLYFATNTCDGPVQNLSFERLFGKLISLQDTMALVVAGRGDRFIKEAVHMAAGMAFFPVGI